ncbi:MAG TPA: PAS domain S-box protein [Thermomicrobiales bacterium]|nr:PAS domain S-box protein [Thermomicrobiales bacterium]
MSLDKDLLTQAQELVHVGTWMWDVQSDMVLLSDELFRLFGLEPQSIELDFGTFLSFVHPDDRERVTGVVQKAMTERSSYHFDHRIITPAGQVRVLHERGFVSCDETGAVTRLIGTGMDVTERAREQAALRDSEAKFRSVFEQSAVGIALADADKRFVRVNASFAGMVGRSPEQLVGMTILDITHPDDVARTGALLRNPEAQSRSVTYEKRYLCPDGRIVWGRASVTRLRHDDGTLNGYMGVVEDITEHKRATETLERQTELLRSIMDNLPVMVALFDAAGSAIYLNKEWQRVFGWTLEEAQSIDVFTAVYPDREARERVRDAVVNGKGWTDFEPVSRDGKPIPSSWACINLSDGTRLTIGKDTSERKTMEQRLVQSQRMEALGQLAGGVAHDFNNILTVITAYATFVQDAVGDKPGVLEDVNEIQAASRRAEGLTRQLLAFSRRQMLKPEVVDVNLAVQTLSKTLNRLIGENIQLAIVPAATVSTVEVDVHQLEQVLLNLVVNARDAIQETGTITMETGNASRDEPRRRDYVVISVSDDGAGIPPSARDRIFEPFFTTKPVGKGTGLGLATVLGIVEQSDGLIEVDSTPGSGTTFRIFLPAVAARPLPTVAGDAAEDLRGTETVLLVEDEASVRAIARRVLTRLGYTVLEARHGADAVTVSESHVGPIHLLITDVVMPEMGGRELSGIMRQKRPGLPILYMSGYTDDELLRRGILETGAQLLRKPFRPNEFVRVVRQLISGGQGRAA